MENHLLIIRQNDFLAQLSDDDYENLDIAHNIVLAEKSSYIYFDAHQIDKLYFVKEGLVRIGNVDNEGNEFIRDILQPGDVFGQVNLMPDNLRGEFAQAYKSDVALCSFTIQRFERLLGQRPDLAITFAKKVGLRMRRIENRLLNLLQKDVRTRVLYFFWTLVAQNGESDLNTFVLPNYLTHDDIARLTGTSRQTVTMLINQFAAEGLLEVDRQTIKLHDIKLWRKRPKSDKQSLPYR
ncbi:Crp/Fnr family transcriptional regulator [Taibaiella lutea]|nr:Crp/Fnr family transcriptional regulator [Taibaiella lutea]